MTASGVPPTTSTDCKENTSARRTSRTVLQAHQDVRWECGEPRKPDEARRKRDCGERDERRLRRRGQMYGQPMLVSLTCPGTGDASARAVREEVREDVPIGVFVTAEVLPMSVKAEPSVRAKS